MPFPKKGAMQATTEIMPFYSVADISAAWSQGTRYGSGLVLRMVWGLYIVGFRV